MIFSVTLILRVYAMYGRSRRILAILLLIYIPAVTIQFVLTAIFDNPKTNLYGMCATISYLSHSHTPCQ
jgi:hypothetical protein